MTDGAARLIEVMLDDPKANVSLFVKSSTRVGDFMDEHCCS